MAHVHNCMLRNLNSILIQAPRIADSSSSPSYNAEDVKDLLFFTAAFLKTLSHHHHVEETALFPPLAALPGVPKDLLDGPIEQHQAFHDGLVELQSYCARYLQEPAGYRWSEMKGILDSFTPALTHHLTAEIDTLHELEQYTDSDAVWQIWCQVEKAAMKDSAFADFYDVFPSMLGSADHTHEGGNEFPAVPGPMKWALQYWFAKRGERPGAWRFCPSDFWGQPRELLFLQEA